MSNLPVAGVQLVVDNETGFITGITTAGAATRKFGEDATGAGQQVSAFGQVATGALRAVGAFAVTALAAAGAAVVGWVSGAKDAATKYERTMSDIVGLTGTSAEEVKQLSTEVLKLSGQVGKGPQELAEALYFVASSGFQGADAMTVLTASAKAAAAGLGDTKTIADLTTSILNAYQMKAGQAAHVTDILTQAVKDGKAEPDQLAGALGRVIPIASAAGINIEEVAASVSSMTRVGLNANESVTALRGLIGSLEKPGKQASDALASIGYSADDMRKSIKERGLLVTLEEMYKRTGGNLDVLGKIVPNIRALTGVLGTTATQGDAYAKTLENMYKASGATDKAFQQATKSMDFQGKALKSTLQALQIELGQALLPGATAVVGALGEIAKSLQGRVGPAITGVIGVVKDVASFLQSAFLPAIAGAATAIIVYAVANAGTLIPALLEQIATLAISAGAWAAQAASVLAAAGPYIAIAAAIGAVVVSYQHLQEQISTATTALLDSRPWWQASTDAVDRYKASVGETRDALTPYAATIQALRTEIESDTRALGEHEVAGKSNYETTGHYIARIQDEQAAINVKKTALEQATGAYNDQEQALLKTAAASMTGTQQLQALRDGEKAVADQTVLTKEEQEKLEKQLQKTYTEGGTAVGKFVETAVGFMATWAANADTHTANVAKLTQEREQAKTEDEKAEIQKRIDAENAAYKQQEVAQALAFAKQEAAQRAHLGQMLEDYTLEQVQLGNIDKETGEKILGEVERRFGIQSDVSGQTFLKMTQDIDSWAKSGSTDAEQLGLKLYGTGEDAIETKTKMEQLAKQYTIEILDNFDPTKDSLDDLRRKLEEVPRRVDIEIVTTKRTIEEGSGTRDKGGPLGTRALGGPVLAGLGAYLVGEKGPELFMPNQNGQIITAGDTANIVRAFGGGAGRTLDSMLVYAQNVQVQAPAATVGSTTTVIYNQTSSGPAFNLGVTTSQSPAAVVQSYHVMRALAGV